MENNLNTFLKNPAPCGIFCFRNVILFLLVFLSCSFYGQARLEVADAKKSFGFVKKGEVVNLDYAITNRGNQPLIISDAEISCSCTQVDFPKQPLLPGQSATVTVHFDTKSAYDRQDRVVYLNSNDPAGKAKLRYKGFVKR